jgi:hypothetical protein
MSEHILSNPAFQRLADRYGEHEEVKLLIASHRALQRDRDDLKRQVGQQTAIRMAWRKIIREELKALRKHKGKP